MNKQTIKNDQSALHMLLNNLDKKVSVMLNENNELKIEDNKIEAWATLDALTKTSDKTIAIETTFILYMLQLCLDNNLGVSLNGIVKDTEFAFDNSELNSVKSIIDTSALMINYLKKEITEEELVKKIEDIEVYVIAKLPNEESNILAIETLSSNESEKPLIPVFLTTYDIDKYNKKNMPVHKLPLKNIIHFFDLYNIAIEPGKEYWALIHT